jgi:hypothetical protein
VLISVTIGGKAVINASPRAEKFVGSARLGAVGSAVIVCVIVVILNKSFNA